MSECVSVGVWKCVEVRMSGERMIAFNANLPLTLTLMYSLCPKRNRLIHAICNGHNSDEMAAYICMGAVYYIYYIRPLSIQCTCAYIIA
jgi:hypothetical protein